MKKFYTLILFAGLFAAGCSSKDDEVAIPSEFDPAFAQVLETRGYVADAYSITPSAVAGIEELDISGAGLTSLRGIEYFTALTTLNCSSNKLTTLNVSQNSLLTTLVCSGNALSGLDVSRNTALTELLCSNNEMSMLSLPSSIEHLSCDWNQLGSLNTADCPSLQKFSCSYSGIYQLDLSRNTALTELYCTGNELTALDVTWNSKLSKLYCHDNMLTSLDISGNQELVEFYCEANPGSGAHFAVASWFDDDNVPTGSSPDGLTYSFTTGSWEYQSVTVTIEYTQR